MVSVTICSDYGAPPPTKKKKYVTVSIISLFICREVMGLEAMILVFWILSFKPIFSLSTFIFIKRLLSSFPLSAKRVKKEMTTHFSSLSWRILWIEETGRLLFIRSHRVGHNWSDLTCMHWRRKWQPTKYSCLENPRDGGAWWGAVYGVTQSQTRLKWLSSSSSHKGVVICITEVTDISPANLDSSMWFFQPGISYNAFCIEVK